MSYFGSIADIHGVAERPAAISHLVPKADRPLTTQLQTFYCFPKKGSSWLKYGMAVERALSGHYRPASLSGGTAFSSTGHSASLRTCRLGVQVPRGGPYAPAAALVRRYPQRYGGVNVGACALPAMNNQLVQWIAVFRWMFAGHPFIGASSLKRVRFPTRHIECSLICSPGAGKLKISLPDVGEPSYATNSYRRYGEATIRRKQKSLRQSRADVIGSFINPLTTQTEVQYVGLRQLDSSPRSCR